MSGPPPAKPRGREWTGSLSQLLNEVRAGLDTPLPAGAQWAARAALDMSSPGRAHRPSPPAGLLHPVPDAPDGRPARDSDDGAEGTAAVELEHAETWELVERAQAGDGEAFGLLYDRYVDVVYKFIFFRVHDRALAEDFTSETFLRALRRIGGISYQGRDVGAWFVTIARNLVLDHRKSARARLETTTAEIFDSADHEATPEAAVLQSLQAEQLMQAVNQLGEEQRDCIILRFMQGLSVSETAAVMGKNDGAIKALQHRAVRKLGELVGSELR